MIFFGLFTEGCSGLVPFSIYIKKKKKKKESFIATLYYYLIFSYVTVIMLTEVFIYINTILIFLLYKVLPFITVQLLQVRPPKENSLKIYQQHLIVKINKN